MTVLSVREVRSFGDELQRDPLQHANHCVSLLNCISHDSQEVSLKLQLHRQAAIETVTLPATAAVAADTKEAAAAAAAPVHAALKAWTA